jgi:release factor glutamine methyltransferase
MRSQAAGPRTDAVAAAVVARLRAAGCVYAEDEARLLRAAATTPVELATMVDQRVDGLPLELVLGWAEFCGLRIEVDPGVFVPRRRTELMVQVAGEVARPAPVVVDLCCGSGAVGVAAAAAIAAVELHAVDVDPTACACARRNVARVGGQVYVGDLYEPLPRRLRGRVDLLLANAPYVPTAELPLLPREARLHETRIALDGGRDGLDVQRRIIADAPTWLSPGGTVLIESSERQVRAMMDMIRRAGLSAVRHRSVELESTVVVGSRRLRRRRPVAQASPRAG